jgi:hypothetical protein
MQLVTSPMAQANPQYAQFQQALKLVEQFTGLDLEKDVHWLTLFAAGGAGEKPEPLLVVQGKFDNTAVADKLKTALAAVGGKEESYKDKKWFSFSDHGLFFPEDSTMLAGSQELIRQAIDKGGKPHALPKSLKAVLEKTPGNHVVWAVLKPDTLLADKNLEAWRSANADLAVNLKKLENVALFFDLAQDGILIKALGFAATPAAAKSVQQYLSERKKDLLHKEGANVVFASLLIFSELSVDGQLVDGSFRLTAQSLKELWNTKFIIRPE